MKIETIEFDEVSNIRPKLQRQIAATIDQYTFPISQRETMALNVHLFDENKFHQFRELCTNNHFSTTYLEGYGIYTIQSCQIQERGGYKDSFVVNVTLMKNKQLWDLIWESVWIETDWDYYENESFDGLTNPPTDWTYIGGSQSIVEDAGEQGTGDDVLKWSGTGTNCYGYFHTAVEPYHINYAIEADIWIHTSATPAVMKYIDSTHWISLRASIGTANNISLIMVDGGTPLTIKIWTVPIEAQEWHNLKMEFEYPFVHCFCDKYYLGTVYNGTIMSGWPAIYTLNNTEYVYFNNVACWPIRPSMVTIPPNYEQLSEYELTTRSSAYGTLGICRPYYRFNVSYKLDGIGELLKVYEEIEPWIQVFNRDHWFENNMVTENGLVRLKFG